jgi:hypothetical protein
VRGGKSPKAGWETLILERCNDAVRRSKQRKCSKESRQLLLVEATALLETQHKKCALCGKLLTFQKHKKETASLDRIFSSVNKSPTRQKHCGYLHNMRWVCNQCNRDTRSCHMPNAKYMHPLCSKK